MKYKNTSGNMVRALINGTWRTIAGGQEFESDSHVGGPACIVQLDAPKKAAKKAAKKAVETTQSTTQAPVTLSEEPTTTKKAKRTKKKTDETEG